MNRHGASSALSTGDIIGLIGLLLALVIAFSYLFMRVGEEKLKGIAALKDEVNDANVQLQNSILQLEAARRTNGQIIEGASRTLLLTVTYLDALGGVVDDLLHAERDVGNDRFASVHQQSIAEIRRSVEEIRLLSADAQIRQDAAKTIAFGSPSIRSLSALGRAAEAYPSDSELAALTKRLREVLEANDLGTGSGA